MHVLLLWAGLHVTKQFLHLTQGQEETAPEILGCKS